MTRSGLMPRRRTGGLVLAVLVAVAGCKPGPSEREGPEKIAPGPSEGGEEAPSVALQSLTEALAEFNRAAALLERYKYLDAVKAFQKVVELAPDWTAARFNLGVAQFNMGEKEGGGEYVKMARQTFEQIVEEDPDHLHARFCLGLCCQHLGDNEKARECFEAVYKQDSDDPYAAYKYAETLLDLERNEEGKEILEKVVEMDPGFVSAAYRLASQYNRSRQREKALPLLLRHKELNAAETSAGAYVVKQVYGMAGKYYMALGADNLPLPPSEQSRPKRIIFSPETKPLSARVQAWQSPGGPVNLPGIAAGDVDGDGDLDLCLTGLDEQGGTAVYLNGGSGGFASGPIVAAKGVSPCLGDADNDGDLDLWLGCAGGEFLLQNDGSGNFYWNLPLRLVSEARVPSDDDRGSGSSEAAVAPAPRANLTTCARMVDIDSDGDLDFLAFRAAGGSVPAAGDQKPAPSSAYNNNRDGSFTDIAPRLGLALPDTPVAAVVYDDFDNDRDTDLVIFPAGDGEPIGWVNDRVWRYRTLDPASTGLTVQGVAGATSGDPDKDGDRDLAVFCGDRVRLFVNRGKFQFRLHESFSSACGGLGGTGGQFADMDNDGDMDLVIADARRPDGARGPALLVNDWPNDRFLNAVELDPGNLFNAIQFEAGASCVVADFTGNGRCDVLLAPAGREPFLIENLTPGGHWIELDLAGTRQRDKSSRSNNSAIGTRVEVRAGRVFQQFVVGVPSGPVAAPPLRVHAGLGDNPKLEWLRIIWPDGILQGEAEIPGDQVAAVTEVERKPYSCPHLFAWNGSRFELVSDFGGMGGLGYFIAPGTYGRPDPTEYLPVACLKPRDGQYVLQAVEPLEEVVYLDEAKLIAVDHPAGTEVYPNEMMAISVPPPAFEVFCVRRPIDPVRAVDHRGIDVTEELCKIDRRSAGATELDRRFPGFAEEHFVELDFGDRLKQVGPENRLILFAHGSVEYSFSSTNFAAGQADVRIEAPSIHVLRDGRWVELFHEVGYPAGLQHTMTLDVTGKILPADRKIRITTNMELSWDRIFLAAHLHDAPLGLTEIPVQSADLHFFGYPREYSPDGRRPNLFDYDNVDRRVPWKLTDGDYTRYGEVGELLGEADDCYVIMARGEELTLRFPVDAFGPVPEGCCRSFILKTDCFCKDMDLYTAYPDTVSPLPFHAMSGYPYGPGEQYPDNEKTREYRRRFNTRRIRTR